MNRLLYRCTRCGIEFESALRNRDTCPTCHGSIEQIGQTDIDGNWMRYESKRSIPIRSAGMVLRVKDYRLEIAEAYIKLYRKYETLIEDGDKQKEARCITDERIAELYREDRAST